MPRKSTPLTSGGDTPAPDVTTFLERLDHPMKAEILATTEHFATFHLRGKRGVQVVMHLGANPRPGVTVRETVPDPDGLLEWKDPTRAVVTFADADVVDARRAAFAAIVRDWIRHV